MQSISEYLISLLCVLITVKDGIFEVGYLLLDRIVEKFCLSADLIGSLAPIIGALANLRVKLFYSLVDFLDLLRLDVFVIDSPLSVFHAEVLVLLLEILDAADQVLLDGGNHLLEAGHLRLDHPVHVVDVLGRGLLQVDQSLLRVADLLLNHTLPTKDICLHLLESLVLGADLLTHDGSLMGQVDCVLLLGTLDYLIHRIEAILHLFHESALALQTLPLIVFQLVEQVDQLLLEGVLRLPKISLPIVDLLFHLPLDLQHNRAHHGSSFFAIGAPVLDQTSLLLVKVGEYLHHAFALLLDLAGQVGLHRAQLLVHVDLAAIEVLLHLLALLGLELQLVSQKGDLRRLLYAQIGDSCCVGRAAAVWSTGGDGNERLRICAGLTRRLRLQHGTVHFYLLQRLRYLVLHLTVPDCQFLHFVRQLGLSGFQSVSCPDRRLLHGLELNTDVLDQLLLLQFKRLHFSLDLLRHIFADLDHFPIKAALVVQQAHLELPQLHLELDALLLQRCGIIMTIICCTARPLPRTSDWTQV